MDSEARRLLAAGRHFEARRALADALGRTIAEQGQAAAHSLRADIANLDVELAPRVGRAWFPVDTAQGFVRGHLVRVDVHASVFPGDRETQSRYATALAAGAKLAQGSADNLTVVLWPRGIEDQIHGRSFELAVAMAAWSRLVGAQIPERVAFSGLIDGDTLSAPHALEAKAKAAIREWGSDALLVTGPAEAPPWRAARNLTAALHCVPALTPTTAPFGERHAAVTKHYRTGHFEHAAEGARLLLADAGDKLDPDERFLIATTRAHALAHLGQHDEAHATWIEARAWADHAPPDAVAEADAVLGIIELDADRPEEGARIVREALARAGAGRWAEAQLHGTAARLASALGDHAEAIRQAHAALERTRPYERARNLHDLAFWQLRGGYLTDATDTLAEAQAALDDARMRDPKAAAATAQFIALARARVAVATDAHEAARALVATVDHPAPALRFGVAELYVTLGDDRPPALRDLEGHPALAPGAPPSVLSRLRARIELRRATPDLRAVARWLGGPVTDPAQTLAALTLRLPY